MSSGKIVEGSLSVLFLYGATVIGQISPMTGPIRVFPIRVFPIRLMSLILLRSQLLVPGIGRWMC